MWALQAALLDAGWAPQFADAWRDPAGDLWQFHDEAADLSRIKQAVREASMAARWKQAAGHHLGQGLGQ